ncbi:MAG TPA: hypothetical protein VEO56_14105, partial [Bacteroidota bacterium]|nr:hypothetical protein [Bacteroidota bacterium]
GATVEGYAPEGARSVFATVLRAKRSVTLRANLPGQRPALSLGKRFSFTRESSNTLLLGSWRMHLGGGGSAAEAFHLPDCDDSAWLQVINGAWEMQLAQERDEATYPVTLWYRTQFEAECVPPDLRLVIDGFSGASHQVFVNGQEPRDGGLRSSLDAEMREIDIHDLARMGTNHVAVKLVVNRRTDGILDLLKIMGDFSLRRSGKSHVIVPPSSTIASGDWTRQGLPFYSGTGVYRAVLNIPARYFGGILVLEVDCGEDVLDVAVNGSSSRIAPWPPYRVEVSDLVREGENLFEIRVTNTLINVLEGVPKTSGIKSPPRLVHYRRCVLTTAST